MTATMSEGITAYDFVQQVYYLQEKTLLDFWPTDDKFREVLVEANLVLRELEGQQDWTWLRETIVVGMCDNVTNDIIKFYLDPDVYKLSMLNHDVLRLYNIDDVDENDNYILNESRYIPVPITSAGNNAYMRQVQEDSFGINHVRDPQLKAIVHGNMIKFSRPLTPWEARMVLVADVQKHIVPFHVCDPLTCTLGTDDSTAAGYQANLVHRCTTDKTSDNKPKKYLTEVPDINYVIVATAARHAEGSPPALARVAGLQDQAQRILSQMRQNDSDATDSDYIEWDVPGYIEVI